MIVVFSSKYLKFVTHLYLQEDVYKEGGISVILAATFICGVRAGTGLLALPQALDQSGN